MHSFSLQGLSYNIKNSKSIKKQIPIGIYSNPNTDQFLLGNKVSNVASNYRILGEKFQNIERQKKLENNNKNIQRNMNSMKYSYLSNNSVLKNNPKITSSRALPPSKNITANIFNNSNFLNPFGFSKKNNISNQVFSNREQVLTTIENHLIDNKINYHDSKNSMNIRQKSISNIPSTCKNNQSKNNINFDNKHFYRINKNLHENHNNNCSHILSHSKNYNSNVNDNLISEKIKEIRNNTRDKIKKIQNKTRKNFIKKNIKCNNYLKTNNSKNKYNNTNNNNRTLKNLTNNSYLSKSKLNNTNINNNDKKTSKKPEINTNVYSEVLQNEIINSCKYNNFQGINYNNLPNSNNKNSNLTTFSNICCSLGNNNIHNKSFSNNKIIDTSKEKSINKDFSKDKSLISQNILSVKACAINSICEAIHKNYQLYNTNLNQKRNFSANSNNNNNNNNYNILNNHHQKNKSGNNVNINRLAFNNFIITNNNDKKKLNIKHTHNKTNYVSHKKKNDILLNSNNVKIYDNSNAINCNSSNNNNKNLVYKNDKKLSNNINIKLDLNPILQGIKLANTNNTNNANNANNIQNKNISISSKNLIYEEVNKENDLNDTNNKKEDEEEEEASNIDFNKIIVEEKNYKTNNDMYTNLEHCKNIDINNNIDNHYYSKDDQLTEQINGTENGKDEILKETRNLLIVNGYTSQLTKQNTNSNSNVCSKVIPKSKINNNFSLLPKNLFEDEDYEYDEDDGVDDNFDDLESIVKILPFNYENVDDVNLFSDDKGISEIYKDFSDNYEKNFEKKIAIKNKNKFSNSNTINNSNNRSYGNNNNNYTNSVTSKKNNKSSERKSYGNLSFSTQDNSNKKFISPVQQRNMHNNNSSSNNNYYY